MPDETIQNYFTLLGAAVPIVVGVLISKVADMESGAGHFQLLLSAPSRTRVYLGKAGALFLGFIWATSVAVGVFGGFSVTKHLLFGLRRCCFF